MGQWRVTVRQETVTSDPPTQIRGDVVPEECRAWFNKAGDGVGEFDRVWLMRRPMGGRIDSEKYVYVQQFGGKF